MELGKSPSCFYEKTLRVVRFGARPALSSDCSHEINKMEMLVARQPYPSIYFLSNDFQKQWLFVFKNHRLLIPSGILKAVFNYHVKIKAPPCADRGPGKNSFLFLRTHLPLEPCEKMACECKFSLLLACDIAKKKKKIKRIVF